MRALLLAQLSNTYKLYTNHLYVCARYCRIVKPTRIPLLPTRHPTPSHAPSLTYTCSQTRVHATRCTTSKRIHACTYTEGPGACSLGIWGEVSVLVCCFSLPFCFLYIHTVIAHFSCVFVPTLCNFWYCNSYCIVCSRFLLCWCGVLARFSLCLLCSARVCYHHFYPPPS